MDSIKNLGSVITEENEITVDVDQRIKSGNKCFCALQNALKAKLLSANLKIKMKFVNTQLKLNVYMTVIRLVCMYAAKTWPLKNNEENIRGKVG